MSFIAWDTTKVVGDLISSSDYNAQVTDQKTRGIPTTENKLGSNCNGVSGATARVLTLANTTTIKTGGFMVFRNGAFIHSTNYARGGQSSSETITFTDINIWDDDYICVVYFL